jgi:hypothetical protein
MASGLSGTAGLPLRGIGAALTDSRDGEAGVEPAVAGEVARRPLQAAVSSAAARIMASANFHKPCPASEACPAAVPLHELPFMCHLLTVCPGFPKPGVFRVPWQDAIGILPLALRPEHYNLCLFLLWLRVGIQHRITNGNPETHKIPRRKQGNCFRSNLKGTEAALKRRRSPWSFAKQNSQAQRALRVEQRKG